jgi:hypothetical protein
MRVKSPLLGTTPDRRGVPPLAGEVSRSRVGRCGSGDSDIMMGLGMSGS